jgi:hypothetical protein
MSAGGHTLIHGKVKGDVGVWFALDTGAPVTALFDGPRTAALQLDSRGARKLGRADDIASPIGVVRQGFDITFGEHVQLSGVTAVIIPEATLPCFDFYEQTGIGGVIGADLMRHLVTEIDSQASQIVLHQTQSFRPPPGYLAIPMEIDRDGFLIIKAGVRSAHARLPQTLRLLVDTGLPTELALHMPNEEAIATVAPSALVSSGCGIGGARRYWRDVQSIELSFGNLMMQVAEPVYEVGLYGFDGLVGASSLYRHRPIVDMPGNRLLLLRDAVQTTASENIVPPQANSGSTMRGVPDATDDGDRSDG